MGFAESSWADRRPIVWSLGPLDKRYAATHFFCQRELSPLFHPFRSRAWVEVLTNSVRGRNGDMLGAELFRGPVG